MKKKAESSFSNSPYRRKLLGWMGIGILAAFAAKVIPFRFVSKKAAEEKRLKDKVNISINELAVKRTKKVI